MKLNILPVNIKTVKLVRKIKKYRSLQMNIPLDIIDRYDLKDGDEIIIAYLGKATDDLNVVQ